MRSLGFEVHLRESEDNNKSEVTWGGHLGRVGWGDGMGHLDSLTAVWDGWRRDGMRDNTTASSYNRSGLCWHCCCSCVVWRTTSIRGGSVITGDNTCRDIAGGALEELWPPRRLGLICVDLRIIGVDFLWFALICDCAQTWWLNLGWSWF